MPRPGVEVYREHPRSYRSTALFAVAIAAGFVLDLTLGGGGAHLWAWLAVFVLVVGLDAVAVRASQRLRSITVTADQLVVGEHVFDRSRFEGVDVPAERDVAAIAPAPRRSVLVGVRVAGGGVLGVPSRRPLELAGALGFRPVPQLLEVRPAGADDLAGLPEIERRADTVFTIGGIGTMPAAATVQDYAAAAAVFVAGRPPVALARVDLVDGTPHLEQLSVVPSHMRRGVGTSLLEATVAWAREQGHDAVTLCTFADVPWNGPFYARHGFVVLPETQWTPGLAALRAADVADGLDAMGPRVVMRRATAAP